MRKSLVLTAMALTFAFGPSIFAAPRAAIAAEQASEVIDGLVTKIDLEHHRVTVRSSDLHIHEFEASAETLKDLKVGDRIEAKRRPEKN